jgi:hypothetical protein
MKKQQYIGLGLIVLGITTFFIVMSYFGLFDTKFEISVEYLSKQVAPFISILITCYGLGLLLSTYKGATKFTGFMFCFFVAVYLVGFLFSRN